MADKGTLSQEQEGGSAGRLADARCCAWENFRWAHGGQDWRREGVATADAAASGFEWLGRRDGRAGLARCRSGPGLGGGWAWHVIGRLTIRRSRRAMRGSPGGMEGQQIGSVTDHWDALGRSQHSLSTA